MKEEKNKQIDIEALKKNLISLNETILGVSLLDIENETDTNLLESMKEDFNDLIKMLIESPTEFNASEFIDSLQRYLDNHERILYSELTSKIIEFNENKDGNIKIGNIITNLEHAIYSHDDNKKESSNIKKILLKLWDHSNLASNQYNSFKVVDALDSKIDELKSQYSSLSNEVTSAEGKMEKAMDGAKNIKNKILTDTIALISIFVAISFVMFGGMTLLNGLFDFSNMQVIPLLELLSLGSLMGIVLIAIIYSFMIFVLKITEKEVGFTKLVNAVVISVLVILVLICGVSSYCVYNSKQQLNNEKVNEMQLKE